jgi:hypothetical protein
MNGRTVTAAAVVFAAAALGWPGIAASAAADEQERLDAAMEAFNERMTAAGWESQGPPEDEDEEFTAGDEAFTECLGELADLFENFDAEEFPGQIAASTSDEFTYAPDTDGPATTEEFSFDLTEETASAFGATVDDASAATITQYIEVMGAKKTGDCMLRAMEAEMEADTEDSDVPVEFDVNVSTESDLGIGDHSAVFGFELSTVFIVPITIDAEVVFAQVGNDFVGIAHLVAGESTSGFDPRVELQSIVDSLGG